MINVDISEAELREQLLNMASDKLLKTVLSYDEGELIDELTRRIEKSTKDVADNAVKTSIDAAIAKHVEPFMTKSIEEIVFQETNRWGEKTGTPMSFREMLLARMEAYIQEPVDYNGKTKAQDSYNWRQHSTRIAHAVDSHLQYRINDAMKAALTEANKAITGGIQQAVKHSLGEVMEKLKIQVVTK